jgi:hypothetical protein
MRWEGGGGGKLERSEGNRVRNGVVRGREVVVSPRRFGGGRMVEGREEEDFVCKVAQSTKWMKCKGEEEDMIRIEMRVNRLITKHLTGYFVVRFV